jgi:hypothetical protein
MLDKQNIIQHLKSELENDTSNSYLKKWIIETQLEELGKEN